MRFEQHLLVNHNSKPLCHKKKRIINKCGKLKQWGLKNIIYFPPKHMVINIYMHVLYDFAHINK